MLELQEFMLIFRYEPIENHQPTQEELEEEEKDWEIFIGEIASQGKLINAYQLGDNAVQVSNNKPDKEGIYISNRETLGGMIVVKATNIEEAVFLSKKCPILKIGGTVEVRSLIPM